MKRNYLILVLLVILVMSGCSDGDNNLMVNDAGEDLVNYTEGDTASNESEDESADEAASDSEDKGSGSEQEAETISHFDYLENHHQDIRLTDMSEVQDLSIFDGVVDRYDVIFTGESHGIAKNYDVYFELIKYFQRESGNLYLLCEDGYGSTALINLFVQTGNHEYLDLVFSALKGTSSWSKEGYEFWEKLYQYNSSLEDDRKIKLVGVDIEHQRDTSLRYLAMIEAKGEMSDRIKPQVESFLQSANEVPDRLVAGVLATEFKQEVDANEDDFREYYGENYSEFSFLLNALVDTVDAYEFRKNGDNEEFGIRREDIMYRNFKYVYDLDPEGLYFGEWGLEHIFQEDCNTYKSGIDRFAMKLNYEDSPVSDRVLSIAYAYYNSFYMGGYWSTGSYHDYPVESYVEDVWVLNEYTEGDFTAFNLIDENSPFKDDKKYFIRKPKEGVTTDYYQYVILIKNSDASTPYDSE